ncbi:MAG: Tat pathway signal protein [Haloarculaceae archaeon]
MLDDGGLSRRDLVKAAVAIGGPAALSACLGRESPDLPTGPEDLSALPERQHAWNDSLSTDQYGNVLAPRHRVLLLLEYDGETPTDADRRALGDALRGLERAYPRGNEGLLFTISYSRAYFERFGAGPAGVDLPRPAAMAPFEDPALDEPDALLHLASDYGSVALGAEAALTGGRDRLNGVAVPTLPDALSVAERRTGFVGAGLPADHQDVTGIPDGDPVPEDSPLYMGFKSGFRGAQATEDDVTVADGPFAGGAAQHLSKIRLHLDQWYEQDSREDRVSRMFCPAHAEAGRVEGVGANLGDGSQLGECPAHAVEDAREAGAVGHSQKAARAREDDRPVILRRDFNSTDDDAAGLHFLSLQSSIADFAATREAMNGTDLAEEGAVGTRTNNGILRYMTVLRRGNYLVPPRSLRAFPRPDPVR